MTSITIFCRRADGSQYSQTVEGKLVGALAVHLTPKVSTDDGKPVFSVTHIATGLKLPLYYETSETAEAVADVLQKLPVDWSGKAIVSDDYQRTHLNSAVKAISALFGGFLIETPIDQPPAGSA